MYIFFNADEELLRDCWGVYFLQYSNYTFLRPQDRIYSINS